MGLRTGAQYLESIKTQKPEVYNLGKRVDNLFEHPVLKSTIATVAKTYDLASNPKYQDLLTVESHLNNERINRFLHPFMSVDDLVMRQHQIRFLQRRLGSCALRCTGLGMGTTLYITSYMIDKKYGTNYHDRFRDFLDYVQKGDLYLSGAMMDVKGDRSLRPAAQPDPDMYLRIVEEKKNGVVVRGCKAHQSGEVISNEIAVIPCTILKGEEEKQYAIAFAIPSDTKGLKYILQHNTADALAYTGADEDLGNPRYGGGFGSTALLIFDDVFIPNERIFMKGEWEFSATAVRSMGLMARMWQSGCRPALMELLAGAAATMAEYNGVEKAAHIKNKINDMVIAGQSVWGLALAAAYLGKPTPSGVYLPDPLTVNVGKYLSINNYWECCKLANDIAGGIITTIPSWKDYKSPETGKWMEKYLKGVADVPTENRIRMARLIQCMAAGPMACGIHQSGGPMENQKIIIGRESEIKEKMHDAKVLCGIEPEDE